MKKYLAFLFLSAASFCAAEEYIQSYGVVMTLNRQGGAVVEETISANAERRRINRGIYRDLPYKFDAGYGVKGSMKYRVISLTRNDNPELYFTENISGKLRVNFGGDDLIPAGINTYVLKYEVTNAAGFFKDYDEVYWNVTGNDWAFRIDRASFTLNLPPHAEVIQNKISFYTGPRGARGQNARRDGNLTFSTTAPLNAGEGFTVAVPFNKGVLEEPSKQELFKSFLENNFKFALPPLWVIIVFLYFYAAWFAVGRDKKIKPVYALYEPPKNATPALASYIWTAGGKEGPHYLSLFLIELALKKCVSIKKDPGFLSFSKTYTLTADRANISALTAQEKAIFDSLFAAGDTVNLTSVYNSGIAVVCDSVESGVKKEGGKYLIKNKAAFGIGFFLAMCFFFITGWISFRNPVIPLLLTVFYAAFIYANAAAAEKIFRNGITGIIAAVLMTLFMLVHSAVFFTLLADSLAFTVIYCVCYVILIFICGLFKFLLLSYTPEGRVLHGELAAFKQYLEVGELGRLAASSPEAQAEVYCKYYAWAAAFGIEKKWNGRFSGVLNDAAARRVVADSGLGSISGRAFIAGALAGSLRSAATPPSQSSGGSSGWSSGGGSGGGGSSGGGHGGGGGGGR